MYPPTIRRLTFALFICLIPAIGFAQTDLTQLEPEAYFDFWVGTWDLTWEAPDGSIETGTNHIEKILDGNVIQENFSAVSGRFKGYEGKSFSVYHEQTGTWRQTWVDSNSGYIDLTGTFEDNKRMFVTKTPASGGGTMLRRMVFYDITKNSFTWDWESSTDNGKTWKLQWRIHYKRREG